jgi:Fur family peroxide stress response transcriptional regulator
MDNTKFSPKETGDKLKANGIKPSVIRIKVLQYLLENRVHPNADTIYKSLVKEIPTLSKTSIYNTLKTFGEKNVVLELSGSNGEVRYDGYTHRHAHFMCTDCGKIYDVKLGCVSCNSDELRNFRVAEESVYMKGTCPECVK